MVKSLLESNASTLGRIGLSRQKEEKPARETETRRSNTVSLETFTLYGFFFQFASSCRTKMKFAWDLPAANMRGG